MYNLENIEKELLKELMEASLININNVVKVYHEYKQYVFENKVEYFHEAIKKKIKKNEKDNVYDYAYYIFNDILDNNKIKEDTHGIKRN